jgi:hypothetical protein
MGFFMFHFQSVYQGIKKFFFQSGFPEVDPHLHLIGTCGNSQLQVPVPASPDEFPDAMERFQFPPGELFINIINPGLIFSEIKRNVVFLSHSSQKAFSPFRVKGLKSCLNRILFPEHQDACPVIYSSRVEQYAVHIERAHAFNHVRIMVFPDKQITVFHPYAHVPGVQLLQQEKWVYSLSPVILHDGLIHNQDSVQINGHPFALHDNPEGVPFLWDCPLP